MNKNELMSMEKNSPFIIKSDDPRHGVGHYGHTHFNLRPKHWKKCGSCFDDVQFMWNCRRDINEILLVGELKSCYTDPMVSTISPLVTDIVMVVVY